MSDAQGEGQDGSEDAAAAKPRFGLTRKKIILIGAAILLLGGGGGTAYTLGFVGGSGEDPVAAVAPPPAYFFDLPDMVVNLSSTDERAAYLKLKIALELESPSLVAAIEPAMPRILDAFQVYLREVRTSDLEGSAGIYRLKEELQRRINLAIHPAEVDGVLFKEILVQ